MALAAACAFGVTTPLVQRYGAHAGPFATAALLYAGAAVATWIPLGGPPGAKVRALHAPRIALVALAGAVVAPVCLAWGVQRTSAVSASLLLNMESVFTVLLARAVFREPIGSRVTAALAAIVSGGVVLVAATGGDLHARTSVLGAIAVIAATLAWAVDNALTRPLAELDPSRVVLAKGALGAVVAAGVSVIAGESRPTAGAAMALLACGATGYGASLRLYLSAQRTLGVARTASIFAVAPFVGAFVAIALGDRPPLVASLSAAVLCAIGVALHLTEHHTHRHSHAAAFHEHTHRHDDAHHDHVHQPPFRGEHSHPHRHDPVTHDHDHAPDVHHAHDHEHDHGDDPA
jgi:drug/metabolite transporter (DMT)-like permease